MATDSLSSEVDKMDLQGERNTTCARAPSMLNYLFQSGESLIELI